MRSNVGFLRVYIVCVFVCVNSHVYECESTTKANKDSRLFWKSMAWCVFGASTHMKICFVQHLIPAAKSREMSMVCFSKQNHMENQFISTYDVYTNNKFGSEIWFKRKLSLYFSLMTFIRENRCQRRRKGVQFDFVKWSILDWPMLTHSHQPHK